VICPKPLQTKHFLSYITISLSISLLLIYVFYCLHSLSAFLSICISKDSLLELKIKFEENNKLAKVAKLKTEEK